ncbi:Serine/threonine-protein kinase SMG1 [Phytophthora citrophthora]|uniref:non-specific serine/threonine protein kinase n=1 Tax=Phytophthora citrophthora TaxID=4793 RepID=A0AAD9LB55_9STRA|nr:Serine/threonine-protein kinase SMG1 [Phytophthora citrophthora]
MNVPDTRAAPPASDAPFNPLVGLQTLLSAEVVSVKQRIKAAQRLEKYFRGLPPTPGLFLAYEPYLLLLTDVMITPVKNGQELQQTVLKLLQTLSGHNPTGFSDWIARNTQLGNEPWLVQWSYVLLLQVEKSVPRESDDTWDEASVEFKEFDRVLARVLQMWRTLLDHTADAALVDQLVTYLEALLMQQTDVEQWRILMLKKLQTHFVDIADVLIGWTMSTGPYSQLRDGILALLNNFGRLWADNSVFSLQLLNSFAEVRELHTQWMSIEIVNLCDSWKNHQEGDDVRLSTLLACFMMVAQCVPDIGASTLCLVIKMLLLKFSNALYRARNQSILLNQPNMYRLGSLFCVANCSEYLVSMSNSKHGNFAALSVAAVRFLLYHCAIQSRLHDSEVGKLSMVLENICKLASANFSGITNPIDVHSVAISALDDEISSRIVKKGGQPKRVKVMECLFHLECANAVTYTTQVCLQLVRLGGIGALKALGTQALKRLNGRSGERGNSYFVFAATCFILICRNPEQITFSRDADESFIIEILELVTAKLEKSSHRFRQYRLTPHQSGLLLKMVSAFIGAVLERIDKPEDSKIVNGVALRLLECTINMLPDEAWVNQDLRLGVETLKVIDTLLSRVAAIPRIPQKACQILLKKVATVVHCSSVEVREGCVQVLETLHTRADTRECSGRVLAVILDLLLDPSLAVQARILSNFSGIAHPALLSQVIPSFSPWEVQPLHSSFVGADFENILSLFQSQELDESEWSRVCSGIMGRATPAKVLSNSNALLGAIHQAAAWCVQNRLRTHFGGPAQSFASIERLLQEYSDEVGLNSQNTRAHQLSTWLLLEFMSELEMRITRAIYDDVDLINPESEECKSSLFFRTNKGVCDDWLNRIRPSLARMSRNSSSYDLCRYHCHAMMMACYAKLSRVMASFASKGSLDKSSSELRQAEKDLDMALYALCRCHCDAKDTDSIVGFQRWGASVSLALGKWYQLNKGHLDCDDKQRGGPLFQWLNAVRYEAEMRYENAAEEYEALLQPVFSSSENANPAKIFESPMIYLRISASSLLECIKQCAKCYVAMRDWTKLRQFATKFIDSAQTLVDCGYHVEEIQAIFDYSDMWSEEINTIRELETESISLTVVSSSRDKLECSATKRAALALRVWNVADRSHLGQPSDPAFPGSFTNQLRRDLIPLVLQRTPWNGFAGEKVGKNAEEVLLKMFGMAKTNHLPVGFHLNEIPDEATKLNPELFDSAIWGQALGFSKHGNADAECICLTAVARLARKQYNFGFAQRLLEEAEAIKEASYASAMELSYEKTKFLETIGMETEGRWLLDTQYEMSVKLVELDQEHSGQGSVVVRSLLRLAKSSMISDDMESPSALSRFIDGALEAATNGGNKLLNEVDDFDFGSSLQDERIFKCIQAATNAAPKSAKAWVHFSHWCYAQGKREIERISEQNGYIHLDPDDESKITSLLDKIGIAEPDRDQVVRAFCHFLENGELVSQRLATFHQLCSELAPPDHSNEAVDDLICLQQACHSKVLRFHTLSAHGYGKYLTVLINDADTNVSRQEITTVALRLLSLLTTYGSVPEVISALKPVLFDGPVDPWSYIVPQLIARADHPVPTVSSLVCLVLKRLAHHSPHAIVFPAVVDSMEPQMTYSNLQEERESASNSFAAVLQELHNVSPGQVEGVRQLVSELRRISILWDEAWINTLVKLSADVARRSSTLEKEAIRVDKNASLSAKEKQELAQRKLLAIMKPIYISIERLWDETCGSVRTQHTVTPHERKFLKEYGSSIEKAMENFRDYSNAELRASSAPMKDPQELWQPFADVLKALMNASGRRDQLALQDISPAMASTSHQLALTNMPGALVGNSRGQVEPVTIHRVDPSVAILRTKTKPKSLELIGSDGKTYKYLLKAREDLRLDERIMQFLRVTNDFLQADVAAAARDLSAQNYSVIPLSRNTGLIQMVPDVVPLFQVYTARNDTGGRGTPDPVASSPVQQPPPPAAQFYAKLKQHGVVNVAPNNRSQWPASVLKQVYQELVSQRPRNVLQQEIISRSEDLRESWVKSARLSKSLAVMSVLGYIVGLGDRHLDNILLCINSGDIVHIDHNVCFDKGRRLKVPEIVPFRLTPMLQDALGFTGVEGRFRVAFETTLRVVRSDDVREALLTLFDAFVYSPLVDWIAEDKRQGRSGDLKARLEVNVNLSLFLSRAEERRQDTISFGRQYEQLADIISRVLKGTGIPFGNLLEKRNLLLSLEKEEQALMQEASSAENELSIYQIAEQTKRVEFESATAQAKDISTKMTSFANECLARHRQIEAWRQKSVSFAESDPATQLSVVTTAVDSASFINVHETLCNVLKHSQFAGQHDYLLSTLESKCHSVDVDVKRLRFEIEKLATCLVPYLLYYGHQRNELDKYLDLELNRSGKDVYYKWWSICAGLASEQKEECTSADVTCSFPSEESISESAVVLSRLSQLPKFQSDEEGDDTGCLSEADTLLQDISNVLSAMKLSNAQGQRLMKLAGASWIIQVFQQLNSDGNGPNANTIRFSPSLIAPSAFVVVVATTHACSTMLELVSTPKGSMKRLRASELLSTSRGEDRKEGASQGLTGLKDILHEVGSFAAVVQEEFISNLHGRHVDGHMEVLGRIKDIVAALEGDITISLLQATADEHPVTRSIFTAAFAVIQKVVSLADTLLHASTILKDEADHFKSVTSVSWVTFVLELLSLTGEGPALEEAVSTIWMAHMDLFASNCLMKMLRVQLSSIITSDWKFDFLLLGDDSANDTDPTSLSKRWSDFFCLQIPDIIPSTQIKLSNGTPETQASDITKAVVELMAICKEWWSNQWSALRPNTWIERVSSLQKKHDRRLRYASWLSTKPGDNGAGHLSRIQMLSFLSSQVPQLNALLTDQVAVEANVLELAQQMDYLASNIGDTCPDLQSNESLHAHVQACYGNVASLFEYGRTLADLVQGISVIETSGGEPTLETEKMELEVDAIGKSLLQSASKATLEVQASSDELNEVVIRVQNLQDKVNQNRETYESLTSRKRAVEDVIHSLSLENKEAVLEGAHVLSKHIKETRNLLKGFDKFKTPSKQSQLESESIRRRQQQGGSDASISVESTIGRFFFMENDRLVKILLRSIRSVNHLELLEGVLEKHGEFCTSLREAVAQLDQILRDFDTQADQLLDGNDQDVSRTYLLLQLLLDLIEMLHVAKNAFHQTDVTEGSSISLLVATRDLVRGCVKLFFEATEMADRLSRTEDENYNANGVADDGGIEEDQCASSEETALHDSENIAGMGESGDSGTSHDTTTSTPRNVEEKSQYGLRVLKRIEEKLSGTVSEMTDAPPVLTVEQQASWLIDEATKTENLCVMYEGWTPWI